ncbi:uncharacterized protein LOC133526524 [Cydia pomonella]|uniref:uncharacterized protein LOC133526524 n=1 Tax=Cydia pomonella TaxID=82600 RepID=UPI002ADD4100|nr:uncharacterized protein LOC133526524 [Cydia pomonella]
MDSIRFLLVLTIAVLIVQNGEALRCWTCNSNGGGDGCADPFLGSADVRDDYMVFTRDCEGAHVLELLPNGTEHANKLGPGLELLCLKLTGKILGKAPVVMRTCASGFPNLTETSCMGSNPANATGGNIETCDACAGDLCNWATRVGPGAVVLFVPLLLLFTLT